MFIPLDSIGERSEESENNDEELCEPDQRFLRLVAGVLEAPLVVVRRKDRIDAAVHHHEGEPDDGGGEPVEEVLKSIELVSWEQLTLRGPLGEFL